MFFSVIYLRDVYFEDFFFSTRFLLCRCRFNEEKIEEMEQKALSSIMNRFSVEQEFVSEREKVPCFDLDFVLFAVFHSCFLFFGSIIMWKKWKGIQGRSRIKWHHASKCNSESDFKREKNIFTSHWSSFGFCRARIKSTFSEIYFARGGEEAWRLINHTHENLTPSSFEKQLWQWSRLFRTRTSVPWMFPSEIGVWQTLHLKQLMW